MLGICYVGVTGAFFMSIFVKYTNGSSLRSFRFFIPSDVRALTVGLCGDGIVSYLFFGYSYATVSSIVLPEI